MTPKNHVQITSLDQLPTYAITQGSLALAKGDPNDYSNHQLAALAQDFTRTYFVSNVATIDVAAIAQSSDIRKFAAIGFELTPDDATAIAEHLTRLEVLNLSNNRIAAAGLRALAEIETLTSLHVANNGVGRGTASLNKLWRLTHLDISNNSLGGKKILALGELANLETLNIDNCHIYAKNLHVLSQLPKLRTLSIADNNIGDEGAEIISDLTALSSLNAPGNNISDATAKNLARHLPKLTNLNLNKHKQD